MLQLAFFTDGVQRLAKAFLPFQFSRFCHVATTNMNVFIKILCEGPTENGALLRANASYNSHSETFAAVRAAIRLE